VVAIINPNSGPVRSGRDATLLCMPHLVRAGVRGIGYVSTRYGQRSLDLITRDINTYRRQVHRGSRAHGGVR